MQCQAAANSMVHSGMHAGSKLRHHVSCELSCAIYDAGISRMKTL